LGEDAEYVVGSSQWADTLRYKGTDIFGTSKRYVELYRRKFNSEPNYQAAGGSAAAIALQTAIEKAVSLDPQKIRDALASLDMITFYGQVKFDQRGINIYKPMLVQQIQDGKLVTVWPPDVAERSVRYPTPPWINP
jgi:branched-chain amino acid transport system substrate-binding protein